jgi:hypothetical protein
LPDLTLTAELVAGPLRTLPERVVERARHLFGGSVALYLTDVAGSCLLRVAGDGDLPDRLTAEGAVGPEFDEDGVRALCEVLTARWPGGAVEPLWVLGRAMGVLITSAPAGNELAELADAAAPMFELATGFTDVFERGRRREQPTAAAEMQLELLPPRMARVARGRIVASVLPAYDVGGDWFDHADNPEGVGSRSRMRWARARAPPRCRPSASARSDRRAARARRSKGAVWRCTTPSKRSAWTRS